MRAVPVQHLKDLDIIAEGIEIATGGIVDNLVAPTKNLFVYMEGNMTLPVYDDVTSKIVGEFVPTERGMVYRPLKVPREPVPGKWMET